MAMEGEIEKEKDEQRKNVFHEKMVRPQRDVLYEDWTAFKKFFEKDSKALTEPFDLAENTAFHVATRSNNPKLFGELMKMLPVEDMWHALRRPNSHKNTILHHAISCTNHEIVDMILDFEKKVPPPPPRDEEASAEAEEKEKPLLEMTNELGETPLYRAAKFGRLKMLKHLAKRVDNLQIHYHRKSVNSVGSILHAAVVNQHFDVAIWLLIQEEKLSDKNTEKLADKKDENELTCLQILSKMPSVFYSHSRMGTMEELVYSLLPKQGYDYRDDEDDSSKILRQEGDLERGVENPVRQRSAILSFLSRINQAIWKFLAYGKNYILPNIRNILPGWKAVEHLWETKKQHMLAEELAERLVKQDNSWQNTYYEKQRSVEVLTVIQPSNVAAAREKLSERLKNQENQDPEQPASARSYSLYTPLLLAASTGIVEIVEKIIVTYPEAVKHVSEDEQNVLHMAVKHRQKEIYKIIKKYGALKWLGSRISHKGRTLLHQVARMEYYTEGNQTGVAFQLRDELRWFERVKKIIPPRYIMHCDDNNLTARQLFEIEHLKMLKEAQEWIKGTSQACSAVAVLVATVVFAAIYAVPGGVNEQGFPKFLHSPGFLVFTIMDVVGLASSLASVVMFLSILTSPFEMQDFYKSLPRKLTLGFTLLFFSLTFTMLAFTATTLLTIPLEANKWSSSLSYSAAFFPVTIFGLMQFPFYVAAKGQLKKMSKKLSKIIPRSFLVKKRNYGDFEGENI